MYQRSNTRFFYCYDVLPPNAHALYQHLKSDNGHDVSDDIYRPMFDILDVVNAKIVVPESRFTWFLQRLRHRYGDRVIVVKKRSPLEILRLLDDLKMSKQQRVFYKNYLTSTDVVRMRQLKSNQRRFLQPYLYDVPHLDEPVIFVDDSLFSGASLTSLAMHYPGSAGLTLYGAMEPMDILYSEAMCQNELQSYYNHQHDNFTM